MEKAAGGIFLGGNDGQIYSQHLRASSATSKLVCNEFKSLFVLKTLTLVCIQESGLPLLHFAFPSNMEIELIFTVS